MKTLERLAAEYGRKMADLQDKKVRQLLKRNGIGMDEWIADPDKFKTEGLALAISQDGEAYTITLSKVVDSISWKAKTPTLNMKG